MSLIERLNKMEWNTLEVDMSLPNNKIKGIVINHSYNLADFWKNERASIINKSSHLYLTQCCTARPALSGADIICPHCHTIIDNVLMAGGSFNKNYPSVMFENQHKVKISSFSVCFKMIPHWNRFLKKDRNFAEAMGIALQTCGKKAYKTDFVPFPIKSGVTFNSLNGRLYHWTRGNKHKSCQDITYNDELKSYSKNSIIKHLDMDFMKACLKQSIIHRPEYRNQLNIVGDIINTKKNDYHKFNKVILYLRWPNLVNLDGLNIVVENLNKETRDTLTKKTSRVKLIKKLFSIGDAMRKICDRGIISYNTAAVLYKLLKHEALVIGQRTTPTRLPYTNYDSNTAQCININKNELCNSAPAQFILDAEEALKHKVFRKAFIEELKVGDTHPMELIRILIDAYSSYIRIKLFRPEYELPPEEMSLGELHDIVSGFYSNILSLNRNGGKFKLLGYPDMTDVVDGFYFSLPYDEYDLSLVGHDDNLKICVATYGKSVHMGALIIMVVHNDDGELVACLEVNKTLNGQLILNQGKGYRNTKPAEDILKAIHKWANKWKLKVNKDEHYWTYNGNNVAADDFDPLF